MSVGLTLQRNLHVGSEAAFFGHTCLRFGLVGALLTISAGVAAEPEAGRAPGGEAKAAKATAIIEVDAAAPLVVVNSRMYGIFFEEINHAGEGGLYAEMVLNRDFEINTLPAGAHWAGNLLRTPKDWQERKWFSNALHGWSLIRQGGAEGAIRQEAVSPLNARNPHSMCLRVTAKGDRIGVTNEGFWGMNFQPGCEYDLSFYARTEGDQRLALKATLESLGGEVYAGADLADVGGGWKQYRCTLRPNRSDPRGRLVLAIDRPGTIWFDVVSLFPRETFKRRPNGVRSDLAQMLAEVKPGFMRFPGGAIVGGLMLSNRIQWKNSIGDITQRQGTMNLWGYYTTNGLGYHEYLQLCEDLGAEALWVCNPGMSDSYRHAEVATPEELPAFVQEALDALEYALGPVESTWGARRAANGHPAPFALKYIEIGNEAHGKQYLDHYKAFYDAIRSKYPAVTIICNQRSQGETPVEMVDDHKYGSPGSFFAAHGQYDKADRAGPKVYVGEYGCTSGVGEGNLLAALSEAAYLLGLERNADVVRMCSYAPLFFNVNDIAWPVNMIGFDSSRAVGRTSYYVQKLFACNRPNHVLGTTVTTAQPTRPGQDNKPPLQDLYALAGIDGKSGELILKTVNRTSRPIETTIRLKGMGKLNSKAKVITLGCEDPTAENTLDEPTRIVPVESAIDGLADEFICAFQPYSLTVLRVGCGPTGP